MTTSKKKMPSLSLAALREWDRKEHDRIISAVTAANEKMVRELLDMEKTNGKTLEAVLSIAAGLEEKVSSYSKKLDEFEKRLEIVERQVKKTAPNGAEVMT